MSKWLVAAEHALREAYLKYGTIGLTNQQLFEAIKDSKLVKLVGNTPINTMNARINFDIKRNPDSIFLKPAQGFFALKEMALTKPELLKPKKTRTKSSKSHQHTRKRRNSSSHFNPNRRNSKSALSPAPLHFAPNFDHEIVQSLNSSNTTQDEYVDIESLSDSEESAYVDTEELSITDIDEDDEAITDDSDAFENTPPSPHQFSPSSLEIFLSSIPDLSLIQPKTPPNFDNFGILLKAAEAELAA